VRPISLIFALLAAVVVASQYFQERRRLSRMAQMPATQARTFHEQSRKKSDRIMVFVAVVFVAAAVGTSVYEYLLQQQR
jgi:uncharacterized membrane protein